MHYSPAGSDVACGRAGQSLSTTQAPEQVTCKSCQRSLGKDHLAAAPAKQATPSLAELRQLKKAQAARAAAFTVRGFWKTRLVALPQRCRLPRGCAGQAFV